MGATKLQNWRKGATDQDFVMNKQFGMRHRGYFVIVQVVGITDDDLVMVVRSGGITDEEFHITKEAMRLRGDVQVLQIPI